MATVYKYFISDSANSKDNEVELPVGTVIERAKARRRLSTASVPLRHGGIVTGDGKFEVGGLSVKLRLYADTHPALKNQMKTWWDYFVSREGSWLIEWGEATVGGSQVVGEYYYYDNVVGYDIVWDTRTRHRACTFVIELLMTTRPYVGNLSV